MNSATVAGSVNVQFFVAGGVVGTDVYRISVKFTGIGQTRRVTLHQSTTGKGMVTLSSTGTFRERLADGEGSIGPFVGTLPFSTIDDGHDIQITITRQ